LLGIGGEGRGYDEVEGDKLVLEFIPDPLSLFMKIGRWAKTAVGEFEKESEEEQNKLFID
jgi:hypothetical protein